MAHQSLTLTLLLCLCAPRLSIQASNFDAVGASTSEAVLASRVCRPGPPLPPPQDGRKNCLIIGDSVSLGYTPVVQGLLNATICQVQHAPFSGDGGALDTKYALQCLDLWLVTAELMHTSYDAIMINSGLHDANYSGKYPEEFTSVSEYTSNLRTIKSRLLASAGSPQLGFATTTPVGFNATLNTLVTHYNDAATTVMAADPEADVFDLYGAVIKVCGQPPYNNCSIQDSNGVHFHPQGYQLLGKMVAAGFRTLLKARERNVPREWSDGTLAMGKTMDRVACPSERAPMSCPPNSTCTKDSFSSLGYGCCLATPSPGQDCGDSWHCCPHGMKCSTGCNMHGCTCENA